MSIKTYALNNHVPIIKDEGLDLLLATIKENKAKAILELGTAIGYSAINMAKLGNDILIDTIEISFFISMEFYICRIPEIMNIHTTFQCQRN